MQIHAQLDLNENQQAQLSKVGLADFKWHSRGNILGTQWWASDFGGVRLHKPLLRRFQLLRIIANQASTLRTLTPTASLRAAGQFPGTQLDFAADFARGSRSARLEKKKSPRLRGTFSGGLPGGGRAWREREME